MNIKQAKEQIKNAMTAYFTKDTTGEYMIPTYQQRPIFLMGPPGIGKTAIMEQIASEMGVALLSYSMTHHTRQSALGLPFIVHKSYQGGAVECDVSEYTMSEIISSIYDLMEETGLKEGILFLDEINCVSETLAPVMLQFLQYKVFGRHHVPEGWIVVTAGNPPEYNNSVREFDIVTWDRLKRIDVEPDFRIWKEYGVNAGVHPAVLTYLENKPNHFYQVQTGVEGKEFVTARGWEDLSRMIRLYELRGMAVERLLIGQYLQDKKIAVSFAQYYDLFRKYRSDYQVDEILDGKAPEGIKQRALAAKFDERLAFIGLMLDALRMETQQVMDQDTVAAQLMTEIKNLLLYIRSTNSTPAEAMTSIMEEKRKRLHSAKKSSAMSTDKQRILRQLMQCLYEEANLLNGVSASEMLPVLKKDFNARVMALKEHAETVGRRMNNMFDFAELVFGEGQELLVIVTELTANKDTASFIGKFGCKKYYRHNKNLLLYERQGEIAEALKELKLN